jgi:hypothetical protein
VGVHSEARLNPYPSPVGRNSGRSVPDLGKSLEIVAGPGEIIESSAYDYNGTCKNL